MTASVRGSILCIQHTAHPMFSPSSSDAAEILTVENRKLLSVPSKERLGLAAVKFNIMNCGIVHPSIEGKPCLGGITGVVRYIDVIASGGFSSTRFPGLLNAAHALHTFHSQMLNHCG